MNDDGNVVLDTDSDDNNNDQQMNNRKDYCDKTLIYFLFKYLLIAAAFVISCVITGYSDNCTFKDNEKSCKIVNNETICEVKCKADNFDNPSTSFYLSFFLTLINGTIAGISFCQKNILYYLDTGKINRSQSNGSDAAWRKMEEKRCHNCLQHYWQNKHNRFGNNFDSSCTYKISKKQIKVFLNLTKSAIKSIKKGWDSTDRFHDFAGFYLQGTETNSEGEKKIVKVAKIMIVKF